MKKKEATIQRGQAITFRLPSDTPDHLLKKMQRLKETEKRNFSSKIAEYVLEGVNNSITKERETVTVPLPKQLSKEQRNWLKHAHSEALVGNIIYQLLADPVRATSVLASLNSNALTIDEALYLQESETEDRYEEPQTEENNLYDIDDVELPEEIEINKSPRSELDDDLDNFDWNKAKEEVAPSVEEEEDVEESPDDLLGDFLSFMNK